MGSQYNNQTQNVNVSNNTTVVVGGIIAGEEKNEDICFIAVLFIIGIALITFIIACIIAIFIAVWLAYLMCIAPIAFAFYKCYKSRKAGMYKALF